MDILTSEYDYPLPFESIAQHPLPYREDSRLLVYQNGGITHAFFRDLPSYLPPKASLFFNDTRVIPARLYFNNDTGARIEIFLLEPFRESLHHCLNATTTCTWTCTIGNLKRWKAGQPLHATNGEYSISAKLLDREGGRVAFEWDTGASFGQLIDALGKTPLPPYLKRQDTSDDRQRYQTVYSNNEGAVAAPTAGIHFSEPILQRLRDAGHTVDFLTLHVAGGTFQPIKSQYIGGHAMHGETLVITNSVIENLLNGGFILPIGTTSLRAIESIYWYGIALANNPHAPFDIAQRLPDENSSANLSATDAIRLVREKLARENKSALKGRTAIYIRPGYRFRIAQGLITNFHQPSSTLLALVSAFIGDMWKTVYQEALDNDYRFLSYGDASLLLP